mmetsp:Transcript_22452/g.21693  ORF Transcript_22452/g.21693 Transcript_22452/m.21693 type:complete len:461 (+) Transcript_22452:104-1486(+)
MVPRKFVTEFQPSVICISVGIAFLGSSCALILSEQWRLTSKENSPKLYNNPTLFFVWSLTFNAIALWATQIVGMSAITLFDSNGNEVEIRYRLDLLLVSLIASNLLCQISTIIATKDEVYAMNKVETLEVYTRDSNNMTIGEMKQRKNRNSIVFRTLFKKISLLLRGSIGFGAAFLIETYLIITSLIIDEGAIQWNTGPLIGIILIIVFSCNIIGWIVFRLLALYPYVESLRFISSVTIAIAISAVHYIVIGAAVTFIHVPGKINPPYLSFSQDQVFIGAIVGSIIFSMFVLIIALADTRFWFYKLSKLFRLHNEMVMNMEKRLNCLEKNDNGDNDHLYLQECRDFILEYKTSLDTTEKVEKLTNSEKNSSVKSTVSKGPRRNKPFTRTSVARIRPVRSRSDLTSSFMFVRPISNNSLVHNSNSRNSFITPPNGNSIRSNGNLNSARKEMNHNSSRSDFL